MLHKSQVQSNDPTHCISQRELLVTAQMYLSEGKQIDRTEIGRLTNERGIDFATAVLYQHFFNQLPAEFQTILDGGPGEQKHPEPPKATLAIVPGALYVERPDVGSDGRMLHVAAEKNDWRVETIPTNGVGRVGENATVIRDWISSRDERLILVSLSKGTTDTVAALFESDQPIPENVAGWVSVSGIPFGTPMVNWMMKRWLFRRIYRFATLIRRASHLAVEDLAFTTKKIKAFNGRDVSFPIYHIAGFPCREHLSCRRSRLWFRRFQHNGPTDSVLMLSDLLEVPGVVIPIWGADHYLKSGWDSCEMFGTIINHLSRQKENRRPREPMTSSVEEKV